MEKTVYVKPLKRKLQRANEESIERLKNSLVCSKTLDDINTDWNKDNNSFISGKTKKKVFRKII